MAKLGRRCFATDAANAILIDEVPTNRNLWRASTEALIVRSVLVFSSLLTELLLPTDEGYGLAVLMSWELEPLILIIAGKKCDSPWKRGHTGTHTVCNNIKRKPFKIRIKGQRRFVS